MYNTRDFYIFGEIIRIGTLDYEKTLFSESGDYISRKAKWIDEEIYCYVESEVIMRSDEEVIDYIRDNIDHEFPEIILRIK